MKHFLLIFMSVCTLQASAQTWTQLGTPPATYEARNHPVTFSIGQMGYITTGAGNFYNSDCYQYDPSNDTWTRLANFPGGPRSFAYGVESGGKGYVGFGLVASSTSVTYYNDLWEFDASNNTWTQLASCPGQGRRHPAMVSTPGKVYVGCGDGATGNLNDWWEYDIATNTWTQQANLPAAVRHHPYFFGIGDDAYVGCGHNGQSIYKDFFKFNAVTKAWTAIPSLPTQGRVAGTQFAYGGKGYLLSGQGEDHRNLATGEMWEYDPATNAWTSKTAHPGTGRWAPGSFVINNTVYLTSGAGFGNSQIDISDLWKFDLPAAVAVNDIVKDNNINLYPNPAQEELFISIDKKIKSIKLTTIYGAVLEASYEITASSKATIDITNLAAGIYLLQVESEGTISTKQFVKQD